MTRYLLVMEGEVMMCLNIFEDDEFPWMRMRAGASFFSAVSVMLMMPWVSLCRVKLDIIAGKWGAVG